MAVMTIPRPLVALLMLAAMLVLGWLWMRWFERSNLYYPDKEITFLPSQVRLAYEDVSFLAPDGTKLHGWFLPGKPGAATLLFCHGNGGNIGHRVQKLRVLSGLGVSIFIFDYAGYGRSAGRPSEKATYRDAVAAYDYLTQERGISPAEIVLYGESLGTAIAVELATRKSTRAMVLESPFTSTIAMGQRLLPWLPVRAMVTYRYDTLSKIPQLELPLLIMHSRADEVIPFDMGQAVYDAARSKKTFFELQGGHNDGYEVTGAGYAEAIGQFLKLTTTLPL